MWGWKVIEWVEGWGLMLQDFLLGEVVILEDLSVVEDMGRRFALVIIM